MATGTPEFITPAWTPLIYHPVRDRAAHSFARFVGLACGRGSGKTEIAKRRLVLATRMKLAHGKPGAFFYAGPTQEQTERIAWDDLLRLMPRSLIARGGVSLSESKITTVFGSSITVLGLDKPQRIEGNQWDGGIIDESCDIKPGAFSRSVVPALTWRFGWCWRIGVPKRQGVGAAEFREWWEEGHAGAVADRECFTWSSEDILDQINPDMLLSAKTTLDAKDYNEQFRARWETAGGVVFHCFDRDANVRPCRYDPTRLLLVGCDFNVDPMAWTVAQLDRTTGTLEVIDELWMRNTNTSEALRVLFERYPSHKGWRFFLDAAGGQRKTSAAIGETDYRTIANHDRMRSHDGRVVFPRRHENGKLEANPPVESRFSSCNARLRTEDGVRHLFIDPSCKKLIGELENRYYVPGTRESAKGFHITDAIGYVIHALWPHALRLDESARPVIVSPG